MAWVPRTRAGKSSQRRRCRKLQTADHSCSTSAASFASAMRVPVSLAASDNPGGRPSYATAILVPPRLSAHRGARDRPSTQARRGTDWFVSISSCEISPRGDRIHAPDRHGLREPTPQGDPSPSLCRCALGGVFESYGAGGGGVDVADCARRPPRVEVRLVDRGPGSSGFASASGCVSQMRRGAGRVTPARRSAPAGRCCRRCVCGRVRWRPRLPEAPVLR